MMDKFLFVLPTDRLGGAERVAQTLVTFLSKEYVDAKIIVYFMSRGDTGGWDDCKILSNVSLIYNNYKSEKTSFPMLVYFILKNCQKVNVTYTTHTHINALLALLRKLKLINTCKLVIRETTIISQRFFGWKKLFLDFLYKSYGSQDLLICQTNLMKNELIKARGYSIARYSHVIPNPLNIEFINNKLMSSVNPQYTSQEFTINIIGRLAAIKNQTLVIKSLFNLKTTLNFKLNIIGDGPMRLELEDLVGKLGLQSRVSFLGNISNPYPYMAKGNLGIISSISEGFPNVLLEMMASGTQNIIITPCTGDLELIPKIIVLENHSIELMTNSIATCIKNTNNYSEIYKQYAQTRDVLSYWTKIKQLTNLK
jgi:glycosyltransferase involved in cell wall biosynthesis